MRYQFGIDESGTGAWAGPFTVGGVLLPYGEKIEGVTDSKKLKDARRRELVPKIQEAATYWVVDYVLPGEIRKSGQGLAWQETIVGLVKSMLAALEELGIKPGEVDIMVDGATHGRLREQIARVAHNGVRVFFQPKADATHQSVGAASILAKTLRNDRMNVLHEKYPEYGFAKNSGYGTEDHAYALVCHGRTKHHRPFVDNFHVLVRKD